MSENFGFEPYEGKEPFVFICYKTEDKNVVSEIATRLKDRGVRVWYDWGINPGQHWRTVISEHIRDCVAVLAFTSPNFYKLNNNDSETLLELSMAKDNYRKPILRIEIEQEDINKHSSFVSYLPNSIQFSKWDGKDDCLTKLIGTLDRMNCVTTSNGSLTVEKTVAVQPSKQVNLEEFDFICKKTIDGKGWILIEYTGKEKYVTVPEGITEIGNKAFYKCKLLKSVTIPNSVTSIGDYAFNDCFSLTQITIPNSVTSIGCFAFNDCFSLTQITIPNSVTSIGADAFYNCRNLTIQTPAGSYAEEYAKEKNIRYRSIYQ
ncbi:MAG: leucine-rich repeat protein [Oscillospiraceae bacterium]|jgi:hypothetical protein|nr:leucine-rich repeat protein [Oscillospiraceae bacterium]